MNISELRGLRWKHVNLTPDWAPYEDEVVPPCALVGWSGQDLRRAAELTRLCFPKVTQAVCS
jgi:hypothetical protein